MYCVLEEGETFLIVICRIVHRLLLRECELFVNIINAWLIKEFTVVPLLERWSKAQQRFTGGWGPGPGGAICCFYFYWFISVVWSSFIYWVIANWIKYRVIVIPFFTRSMIHDSIVIKCCFSVSNSSCCSFCLWITIVDCCVAVDRIKE